MSKAGDESSGGGYDAASAAAASGGGELAGRKMVEGKSKFSVTCGRLSQYLKNNGSFGDLKLGISHSFQPQGIHTYTHHLPFFLFSSSPLYFYSDFKLELGFFFSLIEIPRAEHGLRFFYSSE